ncbi:hypothetical protein VP1G_01719 [Cytospora mali]|uniref:Uncharacterized protein n=1 Tax=Cytospora mali TaxID=578113 RepID=A0A194URW4_CYTMA|nr:hypothetical protein VP1G_01719 [Valsa mali var. pyri (nom. inval.)]
MSSNPIRPALRAGRSALEASVRTSAPASQQQQSRCFSASTARQAGQVITFSKTSNKELDTILHELQHKVLLPALLPVEQRKKIFRARYKEKLEQSPIEIEIDGQRIKFRNLDWRAGEVPNARKLFYQALGNMKTKEDWQKLPKLLEAIYYNANRKFESQDWPKMVRKAGFSGNLGPVIDAAKKPERTGFKLDASEKVQEILSFTVWEAAAADFQPWALETALKSAERILELMGQEGHEFNHKDKEYLAVFKQRTPLRKDPQILATPLFLTAMLAVKHGKTEYQDKMRRYAQAILSAWPEEKGLLELHPHEAYVDSENGMQYLMKKNKFLLVASPILKGLDLAVQGLGDDLASQLKLRRDPVAEEVRSALETQDSKDGRGKQMYYKCYPEEKKAESQKLAEPQEAQVA